MKNLRTGLLFIAVATVCFWFYSCASIGNPQGGARDEDAPKYVKSNPPLGAVGVSRQKVEIEFDEFINVRDAFSKVVVSPTGSSVPRVSSQGKRVSVLFGDSLMPNTTYTIDFGNAIEDFNEGNKIPNYAFWFSTGNAIDSLQIAGMVLAAENLEPQQGMLVGVHTNFADSAFKRLKLERVAKTDDRGRFVLRNLKPGNYRLFALADINNDFRWDNPEENIAFCDFTISPYCQPTIATDTVYDLKTGKIDTIVERSRTRFLPNNILLSSFNINYKPQYLVDYKRNDSTRISLIFNAKSNRLPELSLIDFPKEKDWYVLQRSAGNDTLTYWLKPDFVRRDSLRIAATYLRSDQQQTLVSTTDSLLFVTLRPKIKKDKKQKKTAIVDSLKTINTPMLDIATTASPAHDIYNPLVLTFSEPLIETNLNGFHFETMVDSVWTKITNFKFQPLDSVDILRYKIDYPLAYNSEYRLSVDSIACVGLYGHLNAPLTAQFKVKKEEEYSHLYFNISGMNDSIPMFVELLRDDNPVRQVCVENGTAAFLNLDAGIYYARLTEDANGNNRFDTGSYDEKRQPENVYYYPKKINLKRNWEITESWNPNETPVDRQKPDAIKKNLPETPKNSNHRRNNESTEDEENEYFDVNQNPFDPNSNRRKQNEKSYRQ